MTVKPINDKGVEALSQQETSNLPKILHVDDDPAFLDLFEIMFRKHFTIESVNDGNKALSLLKTGSYDLLTTDYDMPEMNGLEVLKEIKKIDSDIPVVFYTGQGNEEIAREAFILGAADYFTKEVMQFAHKDKIINSLKKAIEARKSKIEKKQSERKYKLLFENANDAIMLYKRPYLIDCNKKTTEMFGIQKDEFIGNTPAHFSPERQPDGMLSSEKSLKYIEKALKGEPQIFEWLHKRRNGETFYCEVNLNRMELEGETLILSFVRDIDKRKKLEQERISHINYLENLEKVERIIRYASNLEEMLNQLLKLTLEIFNTDRIWLLYPCNPNAPHWGVPSFYSKEEYPAAMKRTDIYPVSEASKKIFSEALATDSSVTYDIEKDFPDSEFLKIFNVRSLINTALRPKIGSPWLFGMHQCSYKRNWTKEEMKLFREIGYRMTDSISSFLSLKNLKESEKKFRAAVENMPILMNAFDEEGNILVWNQESERVTGYSADEIIGNPKVIELLYPEKEEQEYVRRKTTDKKKGGYVYRDEFTLTAKDGSKKTISWIDYSQKHPIPGWAVWVIGIDITEQKETEKKNQSYLTFLENLELVEKIIRETHNIDLMLKKVLDQVLNIYDCDRAWLLYPCNPKAPTFRVPMERTKPEYPGAEIDGKDIEMFPDTAINLERALQAREPVCYDPKSGLILDKGATIYGVKSQMHYAIFPQIGEPWMFGIHQCSYSRIWTEDEKTLFKEIGQRITEGLNNLLLLRNLKERESRYRHLIENMNDGIIVIDNNSFFTYLNPKMYEILGYSKENLENRNIEEFVDEHNRKILRTQILKRKEGNHKAYELDLIQKDGNKISTIVSPMPIFDESDVYKGSFAVITDITYQKKMERELRESLAIIDQVRKIFIKGPVVVFKWKNLPNWPVEYVSENSQEIIGFPPTDFTSGKVTYASLIHKNDIERVIGEVEEFSGSQTNNFKHLPYRLKKKDGSIIWIDDFTTIIRNDSGEITHYLGYIINITDRIKTEEELIMRNRELDDFAHIVSHDLKSPISLIYNYLSLIRSEPELFDEYFDRTLKLCETSTSFINSLLSLSKVGKIIKEKIPVNLKKETEKIFNSVKSENIQADLVFTTQIPQINADLLGLQHILSNLLENSMKHRDPDKEKLLIEVSHQRKNNKNIIIFKDNGMGIPSACINKIFYPGFTVTKDKGTGFGLAIVKKIIEAHNGKIKAVSDGEKQGAEFHLEFPII